VWNKKIIFCFNFSIERIFCCRLGEKILGRGQEKPEMGKEKGEDGR
jgi:hypothetical protein